jgi:hypothetical protein
MADLTQAYEALKKADAAGNTADAKQLADYIRSSSASPAPKEIANGATQQLPAWSATGNDQIGAANAAANASEHGPVQDVIDMAKGIPAGAGKTFSNIGTAVQHPIDTAKAIPGAVGSMASTAGHAVMHPVDTSQKVGDYLKNLKPRQAGESVGGMMAGGAAGKAAGAVGDLVGPAAKAAVSGAPKAVSPMVDVAKKAGYVLKPSEAGGKVGKVAEGIAGSPKLSVEASIKNQKVTNRLAAEEIGLPKNSKLTKGAIAEAKKPHNAVYKEMGELGDVPTDPQYSADIQAIGRTPGNSFANAKNPDIDKLRDAYDEQRFNAKDGVLKIRELRASASKNIKAPNAPAQNELGFAQKQIADAIEGQMERHAASVGQTDLVKRFREARQSLAKIHAVESAIKGNTGEVSAPLLARQLDRKVPLSGNLKTIADVANEFGEVTREGTKLKNKVPVTVLDSIGAVGSAGLAGAGHPALGAGGLAGMMARPAVRKALLSKAYQKRLGTQAPKTVGAAKAPTVGAILGARNQEQPQ